MILKNKGGSTLDIFYDGVVEMPKSYVTVNENEMIYTEGGGHIVLNCSQNYLNKNICMSQGNMLVNSRRIVGMTATEIAQEIYAHAFSFYNSAKMVLLVGPVIAAYCYSKAKDGIWIEDGGDSAVRKTAYKFVWNF